MVLEVVHRGKCGDVIYSMAALRGHWKSKGEKTMVYLADNGLFGFPIEEANRVIPLLKSQEYIEDAVYIQEGPPAGAKDLMTIAVDEGEGHHVSALINTAQYACHLLGVDESWAQQQWLEIEPEGEYTAVFNRTPRNQNANVGWPDIVADHPEGRFVGLPDEHEEFERITGVSFMFAETPDLLAVARIIAGTRVFIGNQSAPLAIAHGLHRQVIVETAIDYPNAIFKRQGTSYLGVPSSIVDQYGW
ncbi:MAG: hypothetical protein U0791_05935 [Gemmataceae bacterium]